MKYHATHVGSIQWYHKTPIEKRLNGFAWGCVQNHMDASTSPHFIHVSFDINNASVSSGVWNASKTIIKLPWKLRSCARVRHTVSVQITAWKVTANKALDRGAEMGEIKKREGGEGWAEVKRQRRNNKSSECGKFGLPQMMKTHNRFFVCTGVNYRHIEVKCPCDVDIYKTYSWKITRKSEIQAENHCCVEVQLRVKFRQVLLCACVCVWVYMNEDYHGKLTHKPSVTHAILCAEHWDWGNVL